MKLLFLIVVAVGLVAVAIAEDSHNNNADLRSESNSQEDYVQNNSAIQNDSANVVGHDFAKKVVKFYAIVEKYANHNGDLPFQQNKQPIAVKPTIELVPNYKYLNFNDTKIHGFDQGIIERMVIDVESNIFAVANVFDKLVVEANVKTPWGVIGQFNLSIINATGEVWNLWEDNDNKASNFGYELAVMNSGGSQTNHLPNEQNDSYYLKYLMRSIENVIIQNADDGVVGCLKKEFNETYNMPLGPNNGMHIVNKKTGLKVSMNNTQNWNASADSGKIQSLNVNRNQYKNGFSVEVKAVLFVLPAWQCDIFIGKHQQSANFKNVNFQANDIVATAVLENIVQANGEQKFNVVDVQIKFNGLKFNIPDNQELATEVQLNLSKMMENHMAAVFKQQLMQQHRVCQNSQHECAKCGDQKP